MRTAKALFVLFVLASAGCSIGPIYSRADAPGGGPHPHVSAAGAIHIGYFEVLHAPVTNARPATDITVLTGNIPLVAVGPVSVSVGAGWQVSRAWGACDSSGFNCAKIWTDGWTAAVGLTYRDGPFRADLRGLSFDNSPVGTSDLLPGLEAVVLLFGFSP